jgi:hypothetical protein
LSICLICVAFCDLISICVVLVLFMLTISRSLFLYMLTWMIKLILGLINFSNTVDRHEYQHGFHSIGWIQCVEEVTQMCLDPKETVFKKLEESNQQLKLLYIRGHLDGRPISRMLIDNETVQLTTKTLLLIVSNRICSVAVHPPPPDQHPPWSTPFPTPARPPHPWGRRASPPASLSRGRERPTEAEARLGIGECSEPPEREPRGLAGGNLVWSWKLACSH